MEFDTIELKPLSLKILNFMYNKDPIKAEEIAAQLELKPVQINAAITKSLVRYGFMVREAKLTRVLKKEYNLIKITPKGKRYIDFLNNIKNVNNGQI